jgi:hypothetical protein
VAIAREEIEKRTRPHGFQHRYQCRRRSGPDGATPARACDPAIHRRRAGPAWRRALGDPPKRELHRRARFCRQQRAGLACGLWASRRDGHRSPVGHGGRRTALAPA